MADTGKLALKATSLNQAEKTALQEFSRQLLLLFPGLVCQLALFGSKARGDSGVDSDVDILVIVREENRVLRRQIIDLASNISLQYDVLLSPRIIGEQRWQERRGFSLYQNIARDALPITL